MDRHDWQNLIVSREEDIAWLLEQWEAVRAGEPRLAVILGAKGLGKTRLVQEFYRELSENWDPLNEECPEGYWPDAFQDPKQNLSVNPDPKTVGGDRPIPWLWWGLRCAQPDRRNRTGSACALRDHLQDLLNHTDALAARRELRGKIGDMIRKSASILGAAIPPVSAIMAVTDAADFVGHALPAYRETRERRDATPVETETRALKDLESIAIDHCSLILESSKSGPGLPLILFVDDAQWTDPATLTFLLGLFHRARQQAWPLLVVATHLESEWYEARETSGDREKSSSKFAYLPTLLDLDGEWPGPRLLEPVRGLAMVVRQALPGLSEAQVDLITGKSGGNPWLLHEIIHFLLGEPKYFENRDTGDCLTESAVREIHERPFELHHLIEKRFRNLPHVVKETLSWSSEQGIRFLVDLTVAAARYVHSDVDGEAIEKAVAEGERPHALIQVWVDDKGPAKGEFRQPVFHEVAAKNLRIDEREQRAIRAGLCETLTQWVLENRIVDFPAHERSDALRLGEALLRDGSGDQRDAWMVCLGRLANDYASSYLWKDAVVHAGLFADAVSGSLDFALLPFWDQYAIALLLLDMREHEHARLLIEGLQERLEDGEADEGRSFAALLTALGDLERAEGRREVALEVYRRSLEIAKRIVSEYGETPESLRDLVTSLVKVGDLEAAELRQSVALEAYRRGLEIAERIVSEYGETPESLRDLSVSLNRFGDLEAADGRQSAALEAYRRGLVIAERIVSEYGETPESLRDLSVSLERVGDLEVAELRQSAALEAYRRGLEIDERIVSEYGETPESLRDLSVSLERIGDLEAADGRRNAAMEAYCRGLEIAERIVSEYGETPESLRDLSVSLNRVGDLEAADGRQSAALEAYCRGLEIREHIVSEYGETPESLHDLSVSLNKVGELEAAEGRRSTALEAFRRRLEIAERIVSAYGETRRSLHHLRVMLNKVGDLEAAEGRRNAALEAYRRGLEITERIVSEYGETPDRSAT